MGQLRSALYKRLNLARFFQGEGPQPSPLPLNRRRVFILPTRQGIFFGLMLLLMLLGSINYSNSLGYMLTFLLGSLAVVAILHTYGNLIGLHISVGHIAPTFSGSTVQVPVLLDNAQQPMRFAVTLHLPDASGETCDVPAGGQQTVYLKHLANRRGQQPLGRFIISSRFPLGLLRAWSPVELKQARYLVYPRPAISQHKPLEHLYRATLTGSQGHGAEDFTGLRNYHVGDSLRHVHWKVVAHTQTLLTKQFGGDRCEELLLDWRALPGLDPEARLSQLTRWVLEAERGDLAYGLWLPNAQLPPARGSQHRHRCLKALALY